MKAEHLFKSESYPNLPSENEDVVGCLVRPSEQKKDRIFITKGQADSKDGTDDISFQLVSEVSVEQYIAPFPLAYDFLEHKSWHISEKKGKE